MAKFSLYERGESTIIVPVNVRTADAIPAVEALLLNADTGGFRLAIEQGAWREDIYKSANNVYKVAGLSFDVLRQCAEIVLAAGETDVYVQLPDGESGWFNRSETDIFYKELTGRDPVYTEADGARRVPEHLFDSAADADMQDHHPTYMSAAPAPDYAFAADGLHGANTAFKPTARKEPRLNGTQHSGYPTYMSAAPKSKDGEFTRSVRMLAWAAKALVHERTTKMVLGALPHTHKEIEEAIADVERIYGKPEPSTDEGVRAYNFKR